MNNDELVTRQLPRTSPSVQKKNSVSEKKRLSQSRH